MKTSKFFLFTILCIAFIGVQSSYAQSRQKQQDLTYDIKCGGSGTQGYYIVEVTAYVKKSKEISNALLQKCAVHGVLFRGFQGGQGCTSQRPLAGSALAEQQHPEFFIPFFEQGGGYAAYASMVDGSLKTQKSGKEYKSTAIVSVAKEQLRKDLEKAGVIKGLSSGF